MYRVPLFNTTLAKYKIIWSSLNFSFVKPDTTVSYHKYMEFLIMHIDVEYPVAQAWPSCPMTLLKHILWWAN